MKSSEGPFARTRSERENKPNTKIGLFGGQDLVHGTEGRSQHGVASVQLITVKAGPNGL